MSASGPGDGIGRPGAAALAVEVERVRALAERDHFACAGIWKQPPADVVASPSFTKPAASPTSSLDRSGSAHSVTGAPATGAVPDATTPDSEDPSAAHVAAAAAGDSGVAPARAARGTARAPATVR